MYSQPICNSQKLETVEYYSAIKGKELLIHGATVTNLRNIMLSESQKPKTAYCMSPYI